MGILRTTTILQPVLRSITVITADQIQLAQIIIELERIRTNMKANVDAYTAAIQNGNLTVDQVATFMKGDADQFQRRIERIRAALILLPPTVSIVQSDLVVDLSGVNTIADGTFNADLTTAKKLSDMGTSIKAAIVDREPYDSIIKRPLPVVR